METKNSSLYKKTSVVNFYRDVWNPIYVPKKAEDTYVQISARHHQRPDLLAYELYGTPNLYWVFALRNPDVLIDPVNDFTAGTNIYVPGTEVIARLIG